MKGFYYWVLELTPSGDLVPQRYLLVKDNKDRLIHKFKLTRMGLEGIRSYKELRHLIGPGYYKYNQNK